MRSVASREAVRDLWLPVKLYAQSGFFVNGARGAEGVRTVWCSVRSVELYAF